MVTENRVLDLSWLHALMQERHIKKLKLDRLAVKTRRGGLLVITDGGPFGADRYYGTVRADGAWAPGYFAREDGVPARLEELRAGGVEYLAAEGRRTGTCCFCGLRLDDPESVERGYGPVCARKHGLPHGNRHGF